MTIDWRPHPRFRLYTGAGQLRTAPSAVLPTARRSRRRLEPTLKRRSAAVSTPPPPCAFPWPVPACGVVLQELIRPGQSVVMSPLTIIDVVNMVRLAGGSRSSGISTGIPALSIQTSPNPSSTSGPALSCSPTFTAGRPARRRSVRHLPAARRTAGGGRRPGLRRRRKRPAPGHASAMRACFSFGFYKNVNSWQGGLVVSPDAGLVERIRRRVSGVAPVEVIPASQASASPAGDGSGHLAPVVFYPHPSVVRSRVLRGIPAVVRRSTRSRRPADRRHTAGLPDAR